MSRPGLQSYSCLFRLLPSCFALLVFLSSVGVAGAQNVAPGYPSYTPQDCGEYDCVNLQNLNVSLNVAVYSKSGAFPFNFAMIGGGSYVYVNPLNDTVFPGIFQNPFQAIIGGVLGGSGSYAAPTTETNVTCPSAFGSGAASAFSGWYMQFADGTLHSLPPTDASYSGPTCSGGFSDQVIDGSGYTLTVTSGLTVGSIYTKEGTALTATSITDSNSNELSWSITGKTWMDTLGLSTLTQASSGISWNWTDVNGGSPTVNWTVPNANPMYQTAYGCPGINDSTHGSSYPLPTAVNFPDGTALGLAWEQTPGDPGNTTGRLAQMRLRSGGTVIYNWNPNSAANDGLNCTYLVPNEMTRITTDGKVTFTWAHTSTGNTTTRLDIGQNETVYTFSNGGNATVVTEVQYFLNTGTVASPAYASTATNTVTYCYNSGISPTVSSCPTAAVNEPITQLAVFTSPNGLSPSESYTTFDKYGNTTYSAQYDYGGTTPLVATTNTMAVNGSGNCSNIAATINNKICSSTTTVYNSATNTSPTVAARKYAYSSTGNLLTTSVSPNGGTSYLSNTTTNSYTANGEPLALYDFANNATTFAYNSGYYTNCPACTQYPFPTRRTKGGLNSYASYNGYGGVKTNGEDANLNYTYYYYATTTTCSNGTTADPWNRVMAICDPLNNEVIRNYSATSLTSNYSYGSGAVNNVTSTLDGYGRVTNVQKQKGPSASNWDTASTYRGFSTVIPTVQTTNPCSTASGSQCATTYGPTAGGSVTPAGVLETTLTQSGSNATITTEYEQNTTLMTLSPFPSGENNKETQNVYNGAGWLTSSCAVSSLVSGKVLCSGGSHGFGPSGILTTISYSSASGSETVQSCRGPSGSQQCRTTTTDGLGRVTTKSTPEGGTWNYTYDTACSSTYTNTAGRLAETVDPNGNTLCYSYDALGRVLLVNATNGTTSSCRWFYYDNGAGNGTTSGGYTGTVPSGITLSNQNGRMVEATTDSCTAVASHTSSTLITDEWWAYDKDGRPTTEWELTPNSTQYYESVAIYVGPALTAVDLASPSEFTATYNLDGEGRWNALTVGANVIVPSSGVTYNAAGQPQNISIGTGTDYDSYLWDPNTLLMTNWTFQVNSVQETGALTWNPNNTLEQLVVNDGFNANGSMTCTYNNMSVAGTGYDDLARLVGHSCTGTGGTWSQAFSYDQFNNITTTGTNLPSWNPTYSASTNHYACTGCTYDANGDVTNDGSTAYSWNTFSKMASVNMSGTGCATNGDCIVYDALGRAVEIDDGSTQTEIWYTPLGKTAFMNGTTFRYSYEPAPGGGTVYSERYYFHKDWMGNARIQSLVPGTPSVYTDRAFTPYGEPFNIFGGTGQSDTLFAGLTQDIFSGMYDTPNREMSAVRSRFMSPDPAGSGWNQYAWPTNPNNAADSSGLGGPNGGPGCLARARNESAGGCGYGGLGNTPYGGGEGSDPFGETGQGFTDCDAGGCGSPIPQGSGTVGADAGDDPALITGAYGGSFGGFDGLMQDQVATSPDDPVCPSVDCQGIPGGDTGVPDVTVTAQFIPVATETSANCLGCLIPLIGISDLPLYLQPYNAPVAIVSQYHPPTANVKAVGPTPTPPTPSLTQCFSNPSDAMEQFSGSSGQPGADPNFPSQIYVNGNRGQSQVNSTGEAVGAGIGLLFSGAIDFVNCLIASTF
jgi:RHS repeat-associated protein